MRSWSLISLALLLSACGGGNDGSITAPAPTPAATPTPPPLSELELALQALASNAPLPLFPLTPPTEDAPKLLNGVMIDERNGTYHPAMIARLALERYSRWRTGQPSTGEDWLATAKVQTDWLAANIDCQNGVGVWRYQFPASFGAMPGWTSGFANAHAIAALLIMSRFIDDPERYIRPALCALGPFDVDVAQGGFLTQDGEGKWFEEYATSARSGVLNGHIYALAGLHYACTYAKIQRACDLFREGVIAAKFRLPRYDVGFTSKYSLAEGNYASPGYNGLQADVLQWLHSVTFESVFKTYSDLFRDYDSETAAFTASFTGDPVNHGVEFLNDGYFWYGYWSAYSFPVTVDIDQRSELNIRALALAFAGDEAGAFEYAPVGEDGSVGTYVSAPALQPLTRYVLDEFRTTVGVYAIGIKTRRLRIRFNSPLPGNTVIALREINVLH